MDRVGPGDLRGADDRRDTEVAVGAARRPDADVFVREPDMERVLVRLGIHRDGLDPELLAGVDDPKGDFPAVGYQDLFEHGWYRFNLRSSYRKQSFPVLNRLP